MEDLEVRIESFSVVWAGVGGFELKGSWLSCGSGRIGPAGTLLWVTLLQNSAVVQKR